MDIVKIASGSWTSTVLLGLMSLGSLGYSRSCEWDDNANKRHKAAEEGYEKDMDRLERARNNACGGLTDPTARLQCMRTYDKTIEALTAARQKARAAFKICDYDALKKALEDLEKITKAAKNLIDLVPIVPMFGNGLSMIDPASRIDLRIRTTLTSGVPGNGFVTLQFQPTSTLSLMWDPQQTPPLVDAYPISGAIKINTGNFGTPVSGRRYPMTVASGGFTVNDPGFPTGLYFTVDSTTPETSTVSFDGTNFRGRLNAYYNFGHDGSKFGWAGVSFPFVLSANGVTGSLSTGGFVSHGAIWPVPAVNGYLAPVKLRTLAPFALGTTVPCSLQQMTPQTSNLVALASGVSAPQGQLLGRPWDLDPLSQILHTVVQADGWGYGQFTFAVPNNASMIGAPLVWQSIGPNGTAWIESNSFVAEIIQ